MLWNFQKIARATKRVRFRSDVDVSSCDISVRAAEALPSHAVEDRQTCDGAARDQTCHHPQNQGEVVLVAAVNNRDGLKHVEPAKRDQRDALIALLPPDRQHLRNEKQRVAQQPQSKDHSDNLLHSQIPPVVLAASRANGGGEVAKDVDSFRPAEATIREALAVDERLARNELLRAGDKVALNHDADDATIARCELVGDISRDESLAGGVPVG